MKRHLIVGNGAAAFNAILAIRRLRPDDEITVVSRENCPAYSPMLTPYYVAGRIAYSAMFLCRPGFYSEHGVKVLLGASPETVEPAAQRLRLDDGRLLNYDELLIATGSCPIIPSIPGTGSCLTLWTVQDARRLKSTMQRAGDVVVVGAGLIGLQIVDTLLKLNKKVGLVEVRDRVLARVLDADGAAMVAGRLSERGVKLHLGAQVQGMAKRNGKKIVRLDSGAELEAGALVFAIGVRPNVSFLARSGLRIDRGVVVDEGGRSSIENIFAAGDVAQPINPISGMSEVNATWTNAVHGGWAAGLNMAGQRSVCRQRIRVNVLSPAGLPVVSLGVVEPEPCKDEVSLVSTETCYRKLVFRSNRLVGAVLVGDVGEAGILGRSIENEELSTALKAELVGRSAFYGLAGLLSFGKALHWR